MALSFQEGQGCSEIMYLSPDSSLSAVFVRFGIATDGI